MTSPRLLVIIASTRPGRVGPAIADWFAGLAEQHGGLEIEVADLGELNLPMMDEPNHPRLRQYTHDHTRRWSAIVDAADAVVVVMPEYNYGFNAALKNAIDYLHHEWAYKPIGFVSYGGISGGIRAVQMLKQVVTTLNMFPVPVQVALTNFAQHLVDGVFRPGEPEAAAARMMLDELQKLARPFMELRGVERRGLERTRAELRSA